MRGKKLNLSKSELLAMRDQGMSNLDIAAALDVGLSSVYRIIGVQGKRMDSYAAFGSTPTKVKAQDVLSPKVKYAPEVVSEQLRSENGLVAVLDYRKKDIYIRATDNWSDNPFSALRIPFSEVTELLQILAYTLREKVAPTLKENDETGVVNNDE